MERWLSRLEKLQWWHLLLLIMLMSALMHLRVFPLELMGQHVWRQAQTQNNILSFAQEDMNILNPRVANRGAGDGIQRMEFPLMQWLFAWGFKWFGDHIIISRILSFFVWGLGVAAFYQWLYGLTRKKRLAMVGMWLYAWSPVLYYYSLNPLPDNMALSFGLWGLAFFHHYRSTSKQGSIWLAVLFFALATLVKLPYVLFSIPLWYWGLKGFLQRNVQPVGFAVISLLPAAFWYVSVIPTWGGNGVVAGVTDNPRPWPEYIDIVFTLLVSTIPETLLNYGAVPMLIAGMVALFTFKWYRHPYFPGLLLFGLGLLAYYVYEINMIGKEHDYYLFPFLPLLFLTAAAGTVVMLQHRLRLLRILAVMGLVLLPLLAFLRMDQRWNPNEPGFNPDLLQHAEAIRQQLPDNALVIVGNDRSGHVWLYHLRSKGWAFHSDQLTAEELQQMTRSGAARLVTDSEKVHNNPALQQHVEHLEQYGSIQLYRVKGH